MSVCGLNLESDVGNIWRQQDGVVHKRVFVNLVAANVHDNAQNSLSQRSSATGGLKSAYLAFKKNPSAENWTAVTTLQKQLSFPFSLIDHIDQIGQDFFSDPENPRKTVFFGQGLLGNWTLQITNPLRRLLSLGRQYPNEDYNYDLESGAVSGLDKIEDDYALSCQLLKHLIRGFPEEQRDHQHIVVAISANTTALARCLLFQLLRDAGFSAIILRPHAELLARHIFPAKEPAPILITLGTVKTELRYHPCETTHKTMELDWPEHGEEVDRAIEVLLQERIREAELDHSDCLEFESIPADKLFFWKDAYRSTLWPKIVDSSEYFSEFQYPYKLRDKLTFRDVRPYLSGDLLRAANIRVLESPLSAGLEQILQWTSENGQPDVRQSPPAILLCGSGALVEGIADEIAAIYSKLLDCPKDAVKVSTISQTLDAVVDGAIRYSKDLEDDDWASIEEIQKDWQSISIEQGRLLEWFDSWKKVLAEQRYREALHYVLPFDDRQS
jgi:hypothetical protein